MVPNINKLYQEAVEGDVDAESQLFAALTDGFRIFAHHKVWNQDEAEDLVQEALAIVAAEYKKINIEASFAAWAHKVMDNRILGYIQKQRREKGRAASGDFSEYLAASWTPNPSLRMKLLECLKKVGEANRRYARILNLHLIGFSRPEVCEKLGVTRAQSYVVMSRARAMLKECLDSGGITR
jgi:RNA polymerase sigma factor (sigma-70 family)